MTDTDGAALLAAVLARPDDDTPRLVFADWLDDQPATAVCPTCSGSERDNTGAKWCDRCAGRGWVSSGAGERAAFIRVQVELARWTCDFAQTPEQPGWRHDCGTDEKGYWRCQPLRFRERELFSHQRQWCDFPPLPNGSWSVVLDQDGVTGLNDPNGDSCTVVVRRGMVDELRVPTLATLFGETCSTCDVEPGIRRYPSINGNWIEGPCNVCSGTGRTTPGIAAAVWAAHPITRVVVGDREPSGIDRAGVSWWRESAPRNPMSGVRESARVPDAVYEHLERSATAFTVGRCTYHAGRDAALDALSAACVRLGRVRAGLGPVGWPG